uniref:Uncharacterized protein n=1 Tax=Ditylenchus dipsaci TaxID=166011 RepID=A0A915CMX7_9BILA
MSRNTIDFKPQAQLVEHLASKLNLFASYLYVMQHFSAHFSVGDVKSDEVKKSSLSVDRADFTANEPYFDKPQAIGFGATRAAALEHLEEGLKERCSC